MEHIRMLHEWSGLSVHCYINGNRTHHRHIPRLYIMHRVIKTRLHKHSLTCQVLVISLLIQVKSKKWYHCEMAKYDPTATVCKKKQIEVEKIDMLDI